VARWVDGGWEALEKAGRLFNTVTVKDSWNRPVLLFRNEWNCQQSKPTIPNWNSATQLLLFQANNPRIFSPRRPSFQDGLLTRNSLPARGSATWIL
jgi:hypothetical protein